MTKMLDSIIETFSNKSDLLPGILNAYVNCLGKYINVLRNIAQPSLHELWGDIEDCYEDKLITKEVALQRARDPRMLEEALSK